MAFFSLVPILAGAAGIFLGPAMVDGSQTTSIAMDSHYRYLSGLLMGIGFGFLSSIPRIENKTSRFQLLASLVILGGFSRLYALLTVGIPNEGMLFGLGMELVVTPLLAFMQWRVAHRKR